MTDFMVTSCKYLISFLFHSMNAFRKDPQNFSYNLIIMSAEHFCQWHLWTGREWQRYAARYSAELRNADELPTREYFIASRVISYYRPTDSFGLYLFVRMPNMQLFAVGCRANKMWVCCVAAVMLNVVSCLVA